MPLSKDTKAIKNNMNKETNTVETKIEVAVPQQEKVESPVSTEVDYEALLAQKDSELQKVRDEKENYRKGMLKAKGKIPEENQSDADEPEDLDTIIDRKVQEKLLSTKEAQIQAEKDAAYKAVLKRNKELEVALRNRGQITSSAGVGSNQEKPEGKVDNVLSNDQIANLKAKGWDDKKIEEFKKNLTKVNQQPK